jgi:nucleoside-diphosphate-sugar epimerase
MSYRILLAGAAGAIGKRLTPLLRAAGHYVAGTTRTEAGADILGALGAEPVKVDVFDAEGLLHAVAAARPDIVIHQLTDLPPGLDPARMASATSGNARIRDEGTRNLVKAAIAAGARRLIAQSIAWVYAPGLKPHAEDDPLDAGAEGSRAISVGGIIALENWTLKSPPLAGIVLRYGRFYGPGTGADAPTGPLPLHVDAAAYAALLALDRGDSGIFNIAEPNGEVATEKARPHHGRPPAFSRTE